MAHAPEPLKMTVRHSTTYLSQKEENENRALFLVKKWKKYVEFSIVDISAPGGPRANPSSFLNALYRSDWSQLPPYQISAWSDNVYHVTVLNSKAMPE